MYAIVEIAGQQFKVEKDNQIFVHNLNKEIGSKVEFENVLLLDDQGKIEVGTPIVKDAKVTATVVEELVKGDKVIVFKKKRRKGYKKKNGHRQQFTYIQIDDILFGQEQMQAHETAKTEEVSTLTDEAETIVNEVETQPEEVTTEPITSETQDETLVNKTEEVTEKPLVDTAETQSEAVTTEEENKPLVEEKQVEENTEKTDKNQTEN